MSERKNSEKETRLDKKTELIDQSAELAPIPAIVVAHTAEEFKELGTQWSNEGFEFYSAYNSNAFHSGIEGTGGIEELKDVYSNISEIRVLSCWSGFFQGKPKNMEDTIMLFIKWKDRKPDKSHWEKWIKE